MSPSKSAEPAALRRSEHGSAMIVVIGFASVILISVFSYLLYQMANTGPSLRSPSSLQALFNARSGTYKALYRLIDSTGTDTLKTISTLDSTFGASMFDDSTGTLLADSEKLSFDGEPVTYRLFEDDSLGECDVRLKPAGGICILEATGRFRSRERRVIATLGSRPPARPDTVVVHRNRYPWQGKTPRGTVVADTIDSSSVNMSVFDAIIDKYLTDITDVDSFLLNPPLVIQNARDLSKIDSVVNGPLLLDGAHIGFTWSDTVTVLVKGDLQITGEVTVKGVSFIVGGEIKLLDNCRMTGSALFSGSRIFIGDLARFEGNALALKSIAVYGKAEVSGKSTLIAGASRSTASTKLPSDSLKFSILLSEECTVDAVCIALDVPGSIKTDPETNITGILWAKKFVCHRGRMAGLICAQRVVDCDDPLQMSANSETTAPDSGEKNNALVPTALYNSIPGELEPLSDISRYYLPFYIGRLSIVSWREM